MRLISLLLICIFFIFIYVRRGRLTYFIKNMILWLIIFFVIIAFYAFRFELKYSGERILAVLIPSYSFTNASGQLVISRSSDTHFYVNGLTPNNSKITFLVDTGASDIALTKDDAKKLGVNVGDLKYTQKYNTANGVSYSAPVRIDKLTIGEKTFYNLEAHVSSGGLDISLLGMSIIGKFNDFKITKDMLILSY